MQKKFIGWPEQMPRNELDIVVSKSAKSASYGHGSLVCGCGWREEAVTGVFLRTYLVHSTYVFLCTRATKVGKIVNKTEKYVR